MTNAGYPNRTQLSYATGGEVDHTLLSSWKTGRHRPTRESLRPLAELLNVDIREMEVSAGLAEPDEVGLDRRPSPVPLPPELVRAVALYNRSRVEAPHLTAVYLEIVDEESDYLEQQLDRRQNRQTKRSRKE